MPAENIFAFSSTQGDEWKNSEICRGPDCTCLHSIFQEIFLIIKLPCLDKASQLFLKSSYEMQYKGTGLKANTVKTLQDKDKDRDKNAMG